jgi:flagellin-like protein
MKGISPLIATVLLIAFTVAVGGILSVWLTTFSRTSVDIIGSQSSTQLTCSYSGISLDTMKYSAGQYLSGNVRNTGLIGLGNFTLLVVWENATTLSNQLCSNSTSAFTCTTSNISMSTNDVKSFNISVGGGGNYQTVRLSTNCTNAFATASSSDITLG